MGACVSRAVSDPARRAAGRARSDAAAVLLWAAVRYQNRTLEKRNGERPAGPPSAVRVCRDRRDARCRDAQACAHNEYSL